MHNDHWFGALLNVRGRDSITFGPEEHTERMPIRAGCATQIPGFYGDGHLVVPRPAGFDVLDAPLLSDVEFYGADGTFYEGRRVGSPVIGVNEIELTFEGWSAHLDDDVLRMIFALRALGAWQGPSLERRKDLINADNPHQGDASAISDDTGGPALRLAVTGVWDPATGSVPVCEAWLDAGPGLSIARLIGEFDGDAATNTNFELKVFSAADDHTPAEEVDVFTATSGTIDYQPDTPRRRVGITWVHPAAGGSENGEFGVNIRNLAAIGPHGLQLHPTADGGAPGVRGDEALRYGLGLKSPMLNLDGIDPSFFVIPELALQSFEDRSRTLVERITALGGGQSVPNDWGVGNGKGFFWKPPGSYGNTWEVRLEDGIEPVNVGEDIAELGNGFIGTYTDANDVERSVGFPGSGAERETVELLDTNPLNPVNSSEVPVRVITRDLGSTNAPGALILARLKFQEALEADRRGAYRIPELPGNTAPFYCHGGDRLVVPDDDYTDPQPVVSTTWEMGNPVEANVGAPPDSSEVLVAQLAAAGG